MVFGDTCVDTGNGVWKCEKGYDMKKEFGRYHKLKKVVTYVLALAVSIGLSGTIAKASDPVNPTKPYEGIQIDGNFTDWEGVTRNPGNMDGLQYATMVYDGDMLYFYFQFSENPMRITWSGPNSNGKFTVVNNYGEQMLFQLTQDPNGRVLGVEGATCMANTFDWMGENYAYQWEVGIPASNLPNYTIAGHNDSLSFGYYLADAFITSNVGNIAGGQANPNPDGGESTNPGGDIPNTPGNPDGSGIVYDGNYDDWNQFAMTTIQYKTAGTGDNKVDAEGALYFQNALFGYVRTTIPDHLIEGGGEFTGSTIVKVNNSSNYELRVQYVAVDGAGNINYNPQLTNLPYGTYEFYLIDSAGWKTADNIADWEREGDIRKGTNAVYGKAKISIGPSIDQMEYYMDATKLAAKFGMQPDELKTFSAKYERLGQIWVNCAGASTGPIVGIALCVMITGAVLWYKRKKGLISE